MSTSIESVFETELFDVSLDRTTAVVVAMLSFDALWWVLLFDGHVPMPGTMWLMNQGIPMAAPGAMELGVFHVGSLGALVGYTTMWGVMMWAMMHPAMTRFTRDYAAAHEGSDRNAAAALGSFMTSYLGVWALSAVIPLAFHAVLPGGIYGVTEAHAPLVLGSILVLTGFYQLSSFKQSLLRSCCSRVESHADTPVEAFEEGLHHGVKCIAICFGVFFLVVPFFGEMNFFWMVALTGVITLERIPVWGREVATATGVVSLLAGLFVLLAQPSLPVSFAMAM
ncbi:DUF2182 domain-containing protein [Halorussus halophilus]|uniref:DUF2182 domain-containing protein n=1 Tax=Halorussus halophilus TaxID=2650975 RepID=UPI001300E0DC|nr:DUF2182 domain-containing protein [Halorussus halophilus]